MRRVVFVARHWSFTLCGGFALICLFFGNCLLLRNRIARPFRCGLGTFFCFIGAKVQIYLHICKICCIFAPKIKMNFDKKLRNVRALFLLLRRKVPLPIQGQYGVLCPCSGEGYCGLARRTYSSDCPPDIPSVRLFRFMLRFRSKAVPERGRRALRRRSGERSMAAISPTSECWERLGKMQIRSARVCVCTCAFLVVTLMTIL